MCRPVGRRDAFDMRSQFRRSRLLLAKDDGVDLFANALDVGRAAGRRAVPADEPERQAQVHQFDDRQALARVVAHLPEHLEEALLAAGLAVEGRDQRLRSPGPTAAPRRVQHDVVEADAQRIAGSAKLLRFHASAARLLLENPDLANRPLVQVAGVGWNCRVVQPRHELEKRRGGSREHLLADSEIPRAYGWSHLPRSRHIPLRLLPRRAGRRGRVRLPPARARSNDRSIAVVRPSPLRHARRRGCGRRPPARIALDDRSVAAVGLGERTVGHELTSPQSAALPEAADDIRDQR